MSMRHKSSAPNFSPVQLSFHVKASLPNCTPGSGEIGRFSQLNGQKSSFCLPVDSQKYVICRRKLQVNQKSTVSGGLEKLRSHRPSPSFLLSPINTSHCSAPFTSFSSPALSPQSTSPYLHYYMPVLSSPASPLYAITKYMRTRTGSPIGLTGWKKRSGEKVARVEPKKVHRNLIIEGFLRRFEKKK